MINRPYGHDCIECGVYYDDIRYEEMCFACEEELELRLAEEESKYQKIPMTYSAE